MSKPRPMRCICGNYPKVEMVTNFYGGGRYRGATRSESWQAVCEGQDCWRRAYKGRGVFKTEAEVVVGWNKDIIEEQARLDAPDKLLYDLDQSDDIVKEALARILRAVERGGDDE